MATGGSFDPPGQVTDFWRTPQVTGGALPDGTTDPADTIARTGLTGIGALFAAAAPVSQLDVAVGGRSGTDRRVAGTTALYVTGSLPPLVSCPPGANPATGVVEFLHSNQTQGLGISYQGLYSCGSAARVDMGFQTKGGGLHAFQYEALLPGQPYDFRDNYTAAGLLQGQGYTERWYGGNPNAGACNQLWQDFHILDNPQSAAGSSVRLQNNGFLHGVGMAEADRLKPSYNCNGDPIGFEWWIDANRVGAAAPNALGYKGVTGASGGTLRNRKIVLFNAVDGDTDQFYGFGINGSTLRSQINAQAALFRWYAGTGACLSYEVFSVSGVSNVTIDPSGINFDGRFRNGLLRFGDEGSSAFIAAAAQNPQQILAGQIQPYGAAPFADPGQLNLGTAGAVRLSMAAGNPGVPGGAGAGLYSDNGSGAESVPLWSGWGPGPTAALFTIRRTAAGGQRIPLAIDFHNCAGPCSQNIPPAIAISNVNGTGGGQSGTAGRISWFDPPKTTEYGYIGTSVNGAVLDVVQRGAGQVRLMTNSLVRVTVKANGVVNVANLPVFASDLAAGGGGLVSGDLWRDALGGLHAKI